MHSPIRRDCQRQNIWCRTSLWEKRSPAFQNSLTRRTRSVANLGDALPRQFVGALVHAMPRVSTPPMPVNLVLAERCFEPLPEIHILDRLLVRRAPAVAF